MCPVMRTGRTDAARRSRLGQQMAHEQHRVAHHVVEHAAALQLAAPEPRRMRSAVFLGCARQIGPAGGSRAARPDSRTAGLDLRREYLIFQIAVHGTAALDQLQHALGFGDISRQRLLASDAAQAAHAAFDGVDDFFHVLETHVVGSGEPQRIDARVSHHVADRGVCFGRADVEMPRQRRRGACVLQIRTPHAAHLGVAHGLEALHVETRVETGTDESHAEPPGRVMVRGAAHVVPGVLGPSPSFCSNSAGAPSNFVSGTLPM